MRPAKRTARAMEKFLAQAANAGYDMSKFHSQTQKERVVQEAETAATKQLPRYYEAEGLLLFLEQPSRFMVKVCKRTECQEPFGTNYRSVAYCSDNCRAKDLMKIGIRWDPTKSPEDRWRGEPPLILPPVVVKMLVQQLSALIEPDVVSALQKIEFSEQTPPPPDVQNSTSSPVLPDPGSLIKWDTGDSVFGFD